MAARASAVEIGPGRQCRRRARESGNQRALGEVQLLRRPTEQLPRHRLHAVDAGAQVDPVQIELEYLILAELPVDHHRQRRFAQLPAVGFLVRQEQRPGELLRHRASALHRSRRAQVPDHGAAERNRIDAGVRVKPVVLDRDEGVLEVLGDLAQRDIASMLVHPEPAPAIGGEKPGVPNAPRQSVHGVTLADKPGHREGRRHDEHGIDSRRGAVAPALW